MSSFIRAGVLVSIVMWLAGASLVSATPIISLSPSQATVELGNSVTFDVVIDEAVDLYAYQFTIGFDPAILAAMEITEGSFLSSAGSATFVPGVIDDALGLITFNAGALVGPIPGATGNGTLFSVKFLAHELGVSAVSVLFDAANGDGLFDSSLAAIENPRLVGGSAQVASVPEPATLWLIGVGLVAARLRRHFDLPAERS